MSKEEIKIGDEVIHNTEKYIVTGISNGSYFCLRADGKFLGEYFGTVLKKTGKHFNQVDVNIRQAVVEVLNKMDRYVADELTLCGTERKFPKNEVFIVDDVYEEIVEQLLEQLLPVTSQPKIGRWIFVDKAKEHARCSECNYGNVDLFDGKPHNYCPNCGQPKMKELKEANKEESEKEEPDYTVAENTPCTCFGCKKIITDGRIFRLKGRPEIGLCFDCY